MFINIPLKQTKPIEFQKTFEAYIIKQFQEPKLYEQIKPALDKIQKLRASLDFDRINASTANDIKMSEDLELNILNYIKYLNILKKRFRFEHQNTSSVAIMFYWTSSYSPTQAAQTNSINFELASLYYNLAIVEYYQGQAKLLRETDQDRKQAISRFRNGFWALDVCRGLVGSLPNDIVAMNVDFNTQNINTLDHMVNNFILKELLKLRGLAYKGLYQNLAGNEKNFGLNNVAAVLYESSKEFQLASNSLKILQQECGKKIPQAILDGLAQAINFNLIWTTAVMCIKMSLFHYNKIKDETKNQNMGKALGFLMQAEQSLNSILTDKNAPKLFNSSLLDQLRGLQNQQQQMKVDQETRNQQIYKEKVVVWDMLPYPIIQESLTVKPLVPPTINEPLEDEGLFAGFVSEEAMQLAKEISSFVDERKYELEKAVNTLNDQRNKAYAENYVSTVLDMVHGQGMLQSVKLPTALQQKVDMVRQKGCSSGAQKLIDLQKSMAGQCGMQLGSIKQHLDNEKSEDDRLRQQYQQGWKRQPSDVLNKEFLKAWTDLYQKMAQAGQVDFDILGVYQKAQQYIVLAEQPDTVIYQQIPQDNNSQFYNQNKLQIDELSQADMKVNNEVDGLKLCIFKFMEIVNQTNFTQAAIQGIQNGVQKDVLFEQIIAPAISNIEIFNQKMSVVSALIMQICGLATQIISNQRTTSQISQISNSITAGFQSVYEFFENIEFGLAFYKQNNSYLILLSQLLLHLSDLERKLKDYITARNIEKEELIAFLNKQPAPKGKPTQQAQQYPQQQSGGQYENYYPSQAYPQPYPQQQQQQQYPQQQQQQYPSQQYPQQQNQYAQQQQQQQQWGQQPQQQQQQYPQQGSNVHQNQPQYPQGPQYPNQGQNQYQQPPK